MPDADVVVAHPGTQHSYEAAIALQNFGLLREYVTGLYFKEDGWPYRLGGLLPSKARLRLYAQLAKRQKRGLRDEMVRTYPWIEGAFLVSKHRMTPRWMPDTLPLRNRIFHRLVAAHVKSTAPRALLCYDGCGVEVFQAAAQVGALKILDQTICHITTAAATSDNMADLDLRIKLPTKSQLEQHSEETRQADLILAGSGFVKDSLQRIGISADKIVILPYGVDLELFSPAAERKVGGEVTAIFAGQLAVRKGVTYLLEAFRGLSDLNCRLVLIGGGTKDKKTLERYGVAFDHVPWVPRAELARRYREADFFIFPSLLEGSALVTYEALASGLPVITTPNSGSVVRHGIDGLIVPPRDVDALRKSIQKLAVHGELRRKMGLAARKRAEEYSWSKYHQRLAAIIRNELAKREGAANLAMG
jgi:glycosyltransferase involved in cell wall biosynthesis